MGGVRRARDVTGAIGGREVDGVDGVCGYDHPVPGPLTATDCLTTVRLTHRRRLHAGGASHRRRWGIDAPRRSRHLGVAVGIVAGYLLDRAVGDPRRAHPVAGIGQAAARLEQVLYRDSRSAGTVFAATCVGTATIVGLGLRRLSPSDGIAVAVTGAVTWSALGGTSLTGIGEAIATALDDGDIAAARSWIPSLCGRDPESLDHAGIVRAALESIAENTSDATVAPLFWVGVAGIPGVLAYRTANTLDAMVGYRNDRYRRFGWAAARLDDLANIIPARLTGLLVMVLGGEPSRARRAWRRDAGRHPSPNAGVVEATFAGALGVTLGGRTVYPHGVEERPRLGEGPPPTADDLRAAVVLSRRVQTAAACGAAVMSALLSRRNAR